MKDTEAQEILDAISVVEENPYEYLGRKGTKLKLFSVSSQLVSDAMAKVTPPSVPKYWNDRQERELENPMDPGYVSAVQAFEMRRNTIIVNIYLVMGTTLKSVADGMYKPNDNEWSDDINEIAGELEVPETGRTRYLCWLKYYALTDNDIGDVIQKIQRLSGIVTEKEVDEAVIHFPGDAERGTDTKLSVVQASFDQYSSSVEPR